MIERVRAAINQEFRRLGRVAIVVFGVLFLLQFLATYFVLTKLWQHTIFEWYREILVATLMLLVIGVIALYAIYQSRVRLLRQTNTIIASELHLLLASVERFEALQSMASTLSATLNFERVVDQAVDVCALALEDLGVTRNSLLGAVFLFDGQNLAPLQPLQGDEGQILAGEKGVVGEALRQGEPAVTDNPHKDPELKYFSTFTGCMTVVCVPLRAGYKLFGAMILGIDRAVHFEDKHYDLFNAVADQTVIALQNAQLYQRLEEEKQRLIEADSKARRELARDLHDGPVQKVAVIAMRLNALESIYADDPGRIPDELRKLEILAQDTSTELRGMMFTLRPLLLDSKGLGPAVESILAKIGAREGIETQLVGGEIGDILSRQAKEVVFSIIEEVLSNAAKHAKAKHIDVRFWQESDLFVARVTDDGVGFDPHEISENYDMRGSLGMVNMLERAERIDATLRIDSAPGAGAMITLVVPLANNGLPKPAAPEVEYAS